MVGAKGFEPSTSWSRTRVSENLKSCWCRTYGPNTLQNLPSIGPHGTQAFGLMDGTRRGNVSFRCSKVVPALRCSTATSTAQEADSIGPVPFRGFLEEVAQGWYEASSIRWQDGLFVDKNHAAVFSLFFGPDLEQRWNCPSIVGNERQPLPGGMTQTRRVLLS